MLTNDDADIRNAGELYDATPLLAISYLNKAYPYLRNRYEWYVNIRRGAINILL